MIRKYKVTFEFDVDVGSKMDEAEMWGCATVIINAPPEWKTEPLDGVPNMLEMLINEKWIPEWQAKFEPDNQPLMMPIRAKLSRESE